MTIPRRNFLRLAAGAAMLTAVPEIALALEYPSRPVRIIVGFPPGLATDIVSRLIAQSLSERLRQQVVVDNRPGAGSNIAAELVVRAPPDGYTLLATTVTNTVNETLYEALNFDFVTDIVPVASIDRVPNVMVVNPFFPAKTVPEFIAYAKSNPSKVNYASAGNGSAPNVAGELFKMMTGIDLVHVPYRASFLPDLLGGQVQASFAPMPLTIEYIRDGKLRAIAVTTAKRSDALPDVPAVAEFVTGYEAYSWHGIGAPRSTPIEIVDRINKEINSSLADPTMQTRFAALGAEPAPMTPLEFRQFIADETAKWAKVVKFANIRAG